MKAALTSDSLVAFPQPEGLFVLDTDASDYAIGAVLSQVKDNPVLSGEMEHPIMFASKTLDKAQRRYCVTRRELLAIVVFVQQFRHYLLGQTTVR